MRTLLLVVFCAFTILPGFCQNLKGKLDFVSYKYETGAYEEAIHYGGKLGQNDDYDVPVRIKAKLLQARSLDALFLFKEAEHVLKEAIKLAEKESNNENSAKAFLDISLYLVETGNLLQALAYLEKTKLSETSALRNADGNLVRVKILVKQGFFSHANELLEKQSSFREKNADSASLDQNVFLIKPKEAYAELLILKLQCNIGKGNYKKYEENFPQVKKWINKNLSEYSRSAIKLLELEAKHALFTRNTQQAASLYQQAYQAKQLNYSEISKIENLLELCLRHIEMGHVVHSKKYLRRLHMHAYRKVGKNDPFRIAYEYAKAYQSLHQGDFSSALNRLDKLSKIFAFLPEQHLWNQRIAELSSKLALKSGNIDLYYKGIVNQEKLSGKYYGESSPAYHKTRLALAMYEIRYGNNFRLAEDIINNSYFSIIAKESPEAIENIDYLLAYSELLSYLDNFETAADKSEEAAALAEKIYGLHSPEYLLTFAKHVEFAILAGRYKKGFENLDQAYMLLKNNKHGTHENLQEIMLIFSRMYTLKGEYEKSQTLLSQAYKLSLTGYEQQNLQEADNLENLGSLYLSSGSYFRAEKALLHAFKLRSSSLNEDHPLMLNLYLKLARLHIISGKYDLAEKHLLSSLNIAKNRFGEQSLSYSDCRMVEAEYYVAIGDYKKAELANLEADKIIQAKLGKNNLKRAQVLSELAFIQFRIGKNIGTEIEKRFKEADAIIKNAIGEKNPLSANLYIKLAELYHKSGNAKEAIPLLDYAENYWSEKVGSDNRYTADIHLIRGEIAFLEGKLDQAEKNFKKSQGLYQNIFSDKHTGYVKVTGKLARVYYMQNELSKAFDLMEEIIPTYNDYIIKFFPSLSFREKSKFWNNIREEFEFYNFLALKLTEKSPKLSEKVYNNLILTKALLLNFDIKIRERIFSSKDSILIANYNELIYQKEFLTSAMSLSRQQLIEQKIDLKSVETTIENLEKEISKRSELFSGEEKKRKASYKEIRKTLNDREYAVEIVRYRYFNKTFQDSIIYAALVFNNKSDFPKVVKFENGNKMETAAFTRYRNSAIFNVEDESSYSTYWESIDNMIPAGSTVFLSGDGIYNQINLEMMMDEDGKYTIDKHQIILVSNTKDLLNTNTNKKTLRELAKDQEYSYVLCGNPEFYTDNSGRDIPSLPGAEKEVNEIAKILSTDKKTSVTLLNRMLTEEKLKEIENPSVFHIATHGYFKEGVDDEDNFASSALLNSGLLLYGSGDILADKENYNVNRKEGILTAYEASNLNFYTTELVVLSACETGRGEMRVGEGVYGLQRAFLVAGADAVIMSLFKVNDEVTQKLMVLFYQYWLESGNKRTAFIKAKRSIKQQYNNPLYWGAFVMIEGKPRK